MNEAIQLLLAGLAATSIYMGGVWLSSLIIRNAGIVDVAWSFGFTFVAGLYALFSPPKFPADVVLLSMYVISSLRLTWHLTSRFLRWYPKEDSRYAELRTKMGKSANAKMLLIFLFQGFVLVLFTAPLALALSDGRSQIDTFATFAVFVWLASLLGESLADQQLTEFVKDPQNSTKTCQTGLWRYSRHPNYFFEWLSSVSFALFVSGSPYGLLTWSSPALLMHLLFNVTGIKPSEEHSLKTRSDYADYAKRTSVFVPLPRRKSNDRCDDKQANL